MKTQRQFGKKAFVKTFFGIVLLLFIAKTLHPLFQHAPLAREKQASILDSIQQQALFVDSILEGAHCLPHDLEHKAKGSKHRILSVPNFDRTFPDLNDVQLATANKIGLPPLKNREEASQYKCSKLVYAGKSPFYHVADLHHSIPYLVPRAQLLLNHIARSFIDSLMVKHIPPSIIHVTSLTRTEADVTKLQRINGNASSQSCHCRGTTFDISYIKFHPIQDPDGAPVRQVRDDTLMWVLSEVLRDEREKGLCYIKYEKKQRCFHITVR